MSVCLLVTLMYCCHTVWVSSKIISRLISLWSSLAAADPNVMELERKHPHVLARIGVGYGKSGGPEHKNCTISEMGQDNVQVTIDWLYIIKS